MRAEVAEIIPLFGDRGGSDGGGPENPMLEQRVAKLEEGLGRIEMKLSGIEAELKHLPKAAEYALLRADLAEIKGRLAGTVTSLQLFAALVATWSAGAAIVFALIRFTPK
jgi:hypothetical protein